MDYKSIIMGALSAKGVAYSDKNTDRELEILCETNGIELPEKPKKKATAKKTK